MSAPVAILAVGIVAVVAWLIAEYRRRQRAEAESRAILASAFADIAIVGPTGIVERCNGNWLRAAETADPFVSAGIGEPWMRQVSPANEADLLRLRDAFDAIVSGRTTEELIE